MVIPVVTLRMFGWVFWEQGQLDHNFMGSFYSWIMVVLLRRCSTYDKIEAIITLFGILPYFAVSY